MFRIFALWLCLGALGDAAAAAPDLDHSKWDGLLKQYVNSEARVDYKSLKANSLAELDAYVKQVAAPWPAGMSDASIKAALINAYNALTIRWVLSNYPVESILKTDDPFKAVRQTVDGKATSLDKIEGRLRAMRDPRVHSVLVCAARSCPPLRREAYLPARLDEQLDDNTRVWLANQKLNEFFPAQKLARVSPIFKWYSGDFDAVGGLKPFLAKFAPASNAAFLTKADTKIDFADYNWGLNDASSVGAGYTRWDLFTDAVRLGLRSPLIAGPLGAGLGVAFIAVWLVRRRSAKIRRSALA